jgi:hypothetical protein
MKANHLVDNANGAVSVFLASVVTFAHPVFAEVSWVGQKGPGRVENGPFWMIQDFSP